jgi:hypothetical protein
MKGAIAGIAPGAMIIDLCHSVPPQRVDVAAMFLEGSREYFPTGSIFVTVVDPGVGTSRRAVIVNVRRQYFIGPDNGVLFPLIYKVNWSGVQIENPKYRLAEVSATFHGRDILAPAAAHLAKGATMESFGRKVSALSPLVLPKAHLEGDIIRGVIVHIDSFGNGWTNISKRTLLEAGAWEDRAALWINTGTTTIKGVSETYQSGQKNAPVAVINSFNLLEIAWPDGSAARNLGFQQGANVQVRIEA